jgi:hypothetical protein
MRQHTLFTATALLTGGLLAGTAFAQDVMTAPGTEPNTGAMHLDAGVEWTSAYYFRGLLQEDDGFILQNWIDLGIDLYEGDNWTMAANIGIWNSMHGETDTAGTTDDITEHWYEADLYAGLAFEVEAWTFGVSTIYYTSPSDAFSSIVELDFTCAYDDRDLWGGDFALNPSVTLAIETHDDGGSEDTYLELGIAPGCTWDIDDNTAVDFTFPVTVGLGVDDYYIDAGGDDDFFGFLQVGADASMALPLPDRYGMWSLNGGVHLLFLGDAAEDTNGGDDFEVIGRLGVSLAY